MWIKTANARLIKTKGRIAVSAYQNTFVLLVGAENIASGTKEEMTAVLDRIARALAAGLPFLDLGQPDEEKPAGFESLMKTYNKDSIFLNLSRTISGYKAQVFAYLTDSPVASGAGPTPDAAIANLKPTGK